MIALLAAVAAFSCAHAADQMSLDLCAGQADHRADAAMNVQWKATLAYMHKEDADAAAGASMPYKGPSYADTLLASQRAWLQFRDAECAIEGYAVRGGSMQPMVESQCLAKLSAARTKQLKAMTEVE